MAKGENQKLKLLYLRDLLMETDGEHPITMEEILSQLQARHVDAERKSIYSDIDALRTYGLDISLRKMGRTAAYYLNSRSFETSEIRMLLDSVQVAPFLSGKRSQKLREKVASMSSRHESEISQQGITDLSKNKAQNDSLFRAIDVMQNAMQADVQVRFRYWHYGPDKKQLFLYGGKAVHVSPFALIYQNSCVYLIAYYPPDDACHLYRVDRMSNVALLQTVRTGKEVYAFYEIPDFPSDVLPKQAIVLRITGDGMDAVIDRYGTAVSLLQPLDNSVRVEIMSEAGPAFFGWIVSQNGTISIETESVRNQYTAFLSSILQTD